MISTRIARRYARALLEIAAEQNQLEQWGAELERLAQVVLSPELKDRLTSPELPEPQRIEAMTKIAERLGLSFPLRSFAATLARHQRIAEVGAISEAYQAMADDRLGRARAQLSFAAQPVDGEVAKVIAGLEAVSGKKITPAINVDPALLGGVVAELEGKIYDASLATRLEHLKRQLSE